MRYPHVVTVGAVLLCLLARCASADHAGASQTLMLAVELPSQFTVLGFGAAPAPPVLFSVTAPLAGGPAAVSSRDAGKLAWATWTSAREPRTVTAQLNTDLPAGVALEVGITPRAGRAGMQGHSAPLTATAVQVLEGLSDGGLQDAVLSYRAAVAPGAPTAGVALTVLNTLAD